MAEYIERSEIFRVWKNIPFPASVTSLSAAIHQTPAADVAPVRRGRWIWADDGYCRCSECTQKAPVVRQYQDEPMTTMTNYCPNCGAKMDLEA